MRFELIRNNCQAPYQRSTAHTATGERGFGVEEVLVSRSARTNSLCFHFMCRLGASPAQHSTYRHGRARLGRPRRSPLPLRDNCVLTTSADSQNANRFAAAPPALAAKIAEQVARSYKKPPVVRLTPCL